MFIFLLVYYVLCYDEEFPVIPILFIGNILFNLTTNIFKSNIKYWICKIIGTIFHVLQIMITSVYNWMDDLKIKLFHSLNEMYYDMLLFVLM